jgi:hypothetical protein
MASGLSLSEMGSEGGCWRKVVAAGGGGATLGPASGGRGASWATVAVGVMGETGGRSEVGEPGRVAEAASPTAVSTSSAGMSAG